MALLRIELTEEQQQIVNAERDTHPLEHVRRKMLVLWLLHCGLSREKAAAVRDRIFGEVKTLAVKASAAAKMQEFDLATAWYKTIVGMLLEDDEPRKEALKALEELK